MKTGSNNESFLTEIRLSLLQVAVNCLYLEEIFFHHVNTLSKMTIAELHEMHFH